MRSLIAAVGLFTVVPVPPTEKIDRGVARGAMVAFPWVGLLLGAVGAVLLVAVVAIGAEPLLGAVVALAAVALLTGALHLDGLADTADGLGSRKPAEEALRIMRRSDIGPMGVVSLLFVLLIEVAALSSLAGESVWAAAAALVVATTAGRAAVTVATVSPVSARTEGFGALFTGVTRRRTAVVTVAAVLAVAGALGGVASRRVLAVSDSSSASFGWASEVVNLWAAGVFVGCAAGALLVGAWWARHLRARLGGMTGDVFGSIVEVTQASFLVLVALGVGAIGGSAV